MCVCVCVCVCVCACVCVHVCESEMAGFNCHYSCSGITRFAYGSMKMLPKKAANLV